MQIPHYAILSGLFGTAASVFGKFISYSDEFIDNISIDTSQSVSGPRFKQWKGKTINNWF